MASKKKDKKSLLAKHEAKPYVPPRVKPLQTEVAPAKSLGNLRPLHGILLEPCPKDFGPCLPGFKVVGAWKVINQEAQEDAFLEAMERLGNVKTLYHGTRHHTNVTSILKDGFRLGSFGMFGAGLYFGMPQKAINYTGWGETRFMFKADVVLGNCLVARDPIPSMTYRKLGEFNSVQGSRHYTHAWNGTLVNDEWVVYDTSQVLITHVFELAETKITGNTPKTFACGNFLHRPKLAGTSSPAFRDVFDDTYVLCKKEAPISAAVKTESGQHQSIYFCKECAAQMRKGMQIRIGQLGPYSKTKWKWGTLLG